MKTIGQVYVYPLERAERAMVGFYPILMLTYGAVVGNIIFILLDRKSVV